METNSTPTTSPTPIPSFHLALASPKASHLSPLNKGLIVALVAVFAGLIAMSILYWSRIGHKTKRRTRRRHHNSASHSGSNQESSSSPSGSQTRAGAARNNNTDSPRTHSSTTTVDDTFELPTDSIVRDFGAQTDYLVGAENHHGPQREQANNGTANGTNQNEQGSNVWSNPDLNVDWHTLNERMREQIEMERRRQSPTFSDLGIEMPPRPVVGAGAQQPVVTGKGAAVGAGGEDERTHDQLFAEQSERREVQAAPAAIVEEEDGIGSCLAGAADADSSSEEGNWRVESEGQNETERASRK